MKLLPILSLAISTFLIAACGGGGGGGTNEPLSLSLAGTAATGAAIANATLQAKCATGDALTTTNGDGTFLLTSTSAKLPCMLRVMVPATGDVYHSVAESGATRANVNPMTDMISANVLGAAPATKFQNFSSADASNILASKISDAKLTVIEGAKSVGVDFTGSDPLKDAFIATTSTTSGDVTDKKIDQLMAALAAADKKIAELSLQLANVTKGQAQAAVRNTVGAAASSLSGCPYVRGGNIWTMLYDGTGLTEWAVDIAAMKIGKVGGSTSYTISPLLDTNSAVIPCAYTFNTGTTIVSAYASASGVFAWKEQTIQSGLWQFGLGIPKQASNSFTDTKFVGRMPGLMFMDILQNNTHTLDAAAFYFDVNSLGQVSFSICDLKPTIPSCGAPSPSTDSTVSCKQNSNGSINCSNSDGTVNATALLFVSQQEPTLFMSFSGRISGANVNALMIATKAATLTLPKVGSIISKPNSWYVGRAPKNNANTGWDFYSGESWSGADTEITVVDPAAGSFTRKIGQVTFYNLPSAGTYWIPAYSTSATNYVGLSTAGGFTITAASSYGNRNFDGRYFYIAKPNI